MPTASMNLKHLDNLFEERIKCSKTYPVTIFFPPLQESPEYAEGRCHAFVGDVTDPACEVPFPENSLDVIILIFVLSAISPQK